MTPYNPYDMNSVHDEFRTRVDAYREQRNGGVSIRPISRDYTVSSLAPSAVTTPSATDACRPEADPALGALPDCLSPGSAGTDVCGDGDLSKGGKR